MYFSWNTKSPNTDIICGISYARCVLSFSIPFSFLWHQSLRLGRLLCFVVVSCGNSWCAIDYCTLPTVRLKNFHTATGTTHLVTHIIMWLMWYYCYHETSCVYWIMYFCPLSSSVWARVRWYRSERDIPRSYKINNVAWFTQVDSL
jgi:hypothetical protein